MKWYWKAIKNYANAKGRAGRKEFWWFYAIHLLILFFLVFTETLLRNMAPSFRGELFAKLSDGLSRGVLGTLYTLVTLPPYICIIIRRFHDIGKSGNWYWLSTLPLVSLYCLYLLAKPGTPEANKYGLPSAKISFCRKCGFKLLDGSQFCSNCGTSLAQTNLCSSCGTLFPIDAVCCPQCSHPHVIADSSSKEKTGRISEHMTAGKRKKWPIIVVVFLIFISIIICGFLWLIREQTITPAEAADSVLYLELYDSTGVVIGSASGFLINDNVTLVTNYHVIQDTYRIVAVHANTGQEVDVNNILACDENADLAILRCDSEIGVSPLTLADSDLVQQGDPVYAAGYPLGLANTLSNGIISSRYDEDGVDLLQITAAISEGSSGGALLNDYGQVIGVVSAYYEYGQNLNIAIASNEIVKLLTEARNEIPLKQFYSDTASQSELQQEESVPDVVERTKLVVGTCADFPPFAYYDEDGNIVGMEMLLMYAIAKETDCDFDIIDYPSYEELIYAFKMRDINCLAAGIGESPDMNKFGFASDSWYKYISSDGERCELVIYVKSRQLLKTINKGIRALKANDFIDKIIAYYEEEFPEILVSGTAAPQSSTSGSVSPTDTAGGTSPSVPSTNTTAGSTVDPLIPESTWVNYTLNGIEYGVPDLGYYLGISTIKQYHSSLQQAYFHYAIPSSETEESLLEYYGDMLEVYGFYLSHVTPDNIYVYKNAYCSVLFGLCYGTRYDGVGHPFEVCIIPNDD